MPSRCEAGNGLNALDVPKEFGCSWLALPLLLVLVGLAVGFRLPLDVFSSFVFRWPSFGLLAVPVELLFGVGQASIPFDPPFCPLVPS